LSWLFFTHIIYPLTILLCPHAPVIDDTCFQPFTEDFPCADIHELLSPDLLHQLIKGTFKDHLVTWVKDYLAAEHCKQQADRILADIDRQLVSDNSAEQCNLINCNFSIALVAPFTGLR